MVHHRSLGLAAFSFLIAGAGSVARAADAPAAAPALLAVGSVAPDFAVKAHEGSDVELAKLRGKYVVLYFYPRDDTGGCTKEACSFRDSWAGLQARGILVFGVSTDDNKSHDAFAKKFNLPFPLLPDTTGEIAKKYAVPVVNNAARRITYLIDPQGKVAFVWPSVKPDGHATEILAKVAELPPIPEPTAPAGPGKAVKGKAKGKAKAGKAAAAAP